MAKNLEQALFDYADYVETDAQNDDIGFAGIAEGIRTTVLENTTDLPLMVTVSGQTFNASRVRYIEDVYDWDRLCDVEMHYVKIHFGFFDNICIVGKKAKEVAEEINTQIEKLIKGKRK